MRRSHVVVSANVLIGGASEAFGTLEVDTLSERIFTHPISASSGTTPTCSPPPWTGTKPTANASPAPRSGRPCFANYSTVPRTTWRSSRPCSEWRRGGRSAPKHDAVWKASVSGSKSSPSFTGVSI